MHLDTDFIPADVLVLGTYHMANPGRDLINLVADDVLAGHRQKQLGELSSHLARFQPTTVCVERVLADQPRLDNEFASFLRGDAEPNRNEIVQIGFRVASQCGIERVHGIDDPTPMEWAGIEDYLASHAEDASRFNEELEHAQEEVRRQSEELAITPIADFLRKMNDPAELRRGAAWYVDLAGLGGLGEHGGADMLASWYHRNIRIFSNLAGLTEPGDRILLLFGWGHIPILRSLVELSSRHRLVEASDFL